jgi:hypothetical protein
MKHFFVIAFLLTLISCGGDGTTTPTPTPTPAATLEVVKSAVGTAIGTPVTQAIGSSGGNASVVSAGAKIVVPAGALPDGSSITVQAISNTLDGAGEGIQISGDAWTKPVTLQFSYPTGEADPNSFRIAIQQNDGSWITSKSAKVDTVNRTVSVRLGPASGAGVTANALKSNLKPTAKLDRRNIVMTKSTYLKPGRATVKLGGTVSFTAYAKLAVTEQVPATDDDELVPLTQPVISSKKPIDDDPLEPLPKLRVVVREYPFTNTKAGYNRFWAVEPGPGKIEASGAYSGLYTAPSDPSARGKTATVSFTSFDAKDAVVIGGKVKIEGEPAYQVSATSGNGTITGIICDRSKPFSLLLTVTGYTQGDWNFVPSGDSTGSSNFTLSYLGIATTFSGTYSFSNAADGTAETLSSVGTQTVTAPNVGQVQKPIDETWSLTPIAACAPQ